MNRLMVIIVVCVVALLVTGLMVFLLAKGQRVDDEEPVACDEVAFKPLQDLNPTIRIEKRSRDRFDRIPVYWAIDPPTGRTAMLYSSEVNGKKIEFMPPGETAEIPKQLLYPGSSEPVCLRITEDNRVSKAFWIEVKGRLRDVVTHFHSPNASAQGPWVEGTVYKTQPNGSEVVSHSYFAYETSRGGKFLVRAFVVYDERY